MEQPGLDPSIALPDFTPGVLGDVVRTHRSVV